MVCEKSWVRVPVGPCALSSPVTFGGSVWVCCSGCEQQKDVSSVPAWFRADSRTNLIKQGKIVTGRSYGSLAQWPECSHGMRAVLGSSPGPAMSNFLLCDTSIKRRNSPHPTNNIFPVHPNFLDCSDYRMAVVDFG